METHKIEIINDYTIKIENATHTIINPLKWVVSNDTSFTKPEFCGYNVPHPSDDLLHLTVQFADNSTQTPSNIFAKTITSLISLEKTCDHLLNSLESASLESN
ncbi:DNA-directed RNA polymerases I and III subunit RPAC2 [Enteropsectra breve]|nr:DNA-directed RNA polymerases I and III subunit RPAC2 [Enteropsectra breve]